MTEKKSKLNPLDCQVYKLCTNLKNEKYVIYSLMVFKGQDIMDCEATYILVRSLLLGDDLDASKNKEQKHTEKSSLAFMTFLNAVTEQIFPTKAYKMQKKYIHNIYKHLMMSAWEWIACTIKLNDYLEKFPVFEGIMGTKLPQEETVDILEDGIPLKWKIKFDKGGLI
eukprot:9602335-Ditylum_brightwellii.AAC.1